MLPEATQSKNLIHPTRHDPEEIGKVFPQIVKKCVSLPTGTIHVLLGSDNIQLMPRELERRDRLILYNSMFSGGPDLVVAGLTGDPTPVIFAFATKVSHFAPVDFFVGRGSRHRPTQTVPSLQGM